MTPAAWRVLGRLVAFGSLLALAGCDPPSADESPRASSSALPADPALADVMGNGEIADSPIDRFWADKLASLGLPYESPSGVVAYGEESVPATACGELLPETSWPGNAYYCAEDSSIAYDEDFLARLSESVGDLAGVAVIAHEWGHHVSAQLGEPADAFPVQRELTADCFAGMFAAGTEVSTGDVTAFEDYSRALFELGNEDFAADSWFGRGEHGSPKHRLLAGSIGYRSALGNVDSCRRFATWEPGRRAVIGPWSFVDLPGSQLDAVRSLRVATEADRTPEALLTTWISDRYGQVTFEVRPTPSDDTLNAYSVFRSDGDVYLAGLLVAAKDPGHALVLQTDLGPDATADDVYLAFDVTYDLAASACRPGQVADPGSASYYIMCEPEL